MTRDLSSLPQGDQEAIGRTLTALLTGFRNRDVDALQDVYADDADWVNAFGTVKHSRDGILDHLRGLFNDANFNQGKVVGPPETSFRVLTPDVVLVSAHLRVEGPIVSEMFMDANTETTYER